MLPLQYLANNSPKDNTNPNMTWGTSNYATYTLFDNDTIGKFAHLRYTQIYGDVIYFQIIGATRSDVQGHLASSCYVVHQGELQKMHKGRRFRVY